MPTRSRSSRAILRHFINALSLGIVAVMWAAGTTAHADTIYVDADANGANNGTSWANAFTSLQSALAVATGSDEIWIAGGTYYPTSGSSRTISFTITGDQDGLKIYGGFAGTETQRSQRDIGANQVVLSGDIGNPGSINDNSFHVVLFDGGTALGTSYTANVTTSTVLDGVIITNGHANGSNANAAGAGIFCDGRGSGNACSPTLSNVVVVGNIASVGAGLFNNGSSGGDSSPTLINVLVTSNSARRTGVAC
ncbi:MAG: hypothetical protein AAGJ10_03530 [Bacteroidota bacterium]